MRRKRKQHAFGHRLEGETEKSKDEMVERERDERSTRENGAYEKRVHMAPRALTCKGKRSKHEGIGYMVGVRAILNAEREKE